VSNIGIDMDQREHRGRRRAPRRRRRGAGCLAVLVSLAVLVAIAGFVVVQGRAWLEDQFAPPPDYQGDGSGSVLIEVQPGGVHRRRTRGAACDADPGRLLRHGQEDEC
jgi:hypothetical protein